MLGVGVAAVFLAGAMLTACSSPKSDPAVTATPPGRKPATGSALPSPYFVSPSDPAAGAAAIVAGMSDDELIGAVLMPAVNMDDPAAAAAALVRDHSLGGVILMGQPAQGADTAE